MLKLKKDYTKYKFMENVPDKEKFMEQSIQGKVDGFMKNLVLLKE